ncbi:Bug family tripartite tricarboxylate transporter substrate binding protein [Bradyrhizobium lablabi]|uniref:Bug family tripartite tricarboxylate transporter substrate binding protein n=1 Tax=Bradyrhizobium lablabi TaxID=722472 RepID=UPI000909F08C|nr:tripartite tricarboxylate transporter substrate binding protein [Bradyrhizobium lablabi]SHL09272.1 Tripartite-type tricarboxylate transporter, receptor component TctC [Bradyrhizobium lablabi]
MAGSARNTIIDRRCVLALIGAALAPIPAQAAQYPSRPIKIIVPFGPGGSGDISARLIGKQIEEKTKQAVVVDNRPGANGIIGTMAVKTAEPDGYTVLLITTSTHAANVSLVRNLSYDPAKDFTVVGVFRSSGSYLMVRPEAPWRDLPSFVAAAKAAPGKLVFGYFNASSRTPPEYLGRLAGIELQGVPYRAIANAIADLISGEIHCLFMDTTASNQYLQSGQLRPLAITSLTRARATPDVPAVAETFPGFQLTGFLGMAVPSATPRQTVEQLNGLINEALTAPEVRRRMDEFGLSYDITDLAACEAEVRAERERWTEYTRVAGIQPE